MRTKMRLYQIIMAVISSNAIIFLFINHIFNIYNRG